MPAASFTKLTVFVVPLDHHYKVVSVSDELPMQDRDTAMNSNLQSVPFMEGSIVWCTTVNEVWSLSQLNPSVSVPAKDSVSGCLYNGTSL